MRSRHEQLQRAGGQERRKWGEVNLPPGGRRFGRKEEMKKGRKKGKKKGTIEHLTNREGSTRPDTMGRRILLNETPDFDKRTLHVLSRHRRRPLSVVRPFVVVQRK